LPQIILLEVIAGSVTFPGKKCQGGFDGAILLAKIGCLADSSRKGIRNCICVRLSFQSGDPGLDSLSHCLQGRRGVDFGSAENKILKIAGERRARR
jgi:hypothetical protein